MKKLSAASFGFYQKQGFFFAVTALVLAVVIALNAGISFFTVRKRIYTDLSADERYTLGEQTVSYLSDIFSEAKQNRGADEPLAVRILFCADADVLTSGDLMRMVYFTALNLEKLFPDVITVDTVNVWKNPSAVDDYRINSYSSIYPSNVIVSSGTEFRVFTLRSFFTYEDSTAADPWAYSGEKNFVKGILAVTNAESPICCLTVNHGEPFADLDLDDFENWEEYGEFYRVLKNAGYEVRTIDLEKDDVPERCRLILTVDPQTDFATDFHSESSVSETAKLNEFLDKSYSYLVAVNQDTPYLPNLEEFLEAWGIAFLRDGEKNGIQLVDEANRLDQNGEVFYAQYAEAGLGYSSFSDMLTYGFAPKIAFGNVMGLAFSSTYEETPVLADSDSGTPAYRYAKYQKNAHNRSVYDMFHTGDSAVGYGFENGERTVAATANAAKDLYAMLMSSEKRMIGEGKGYTNVNDASYVSAIGSTDFLSDRYLANSAYGNTNVMLSLLRAIGTEVVPVGLEFKTLFVADVDTDSLSEDGGVAATLWLTLTPLVLAIGSCTVVLVKRRSRH